MKNKTYNIITIGCQMNKSDSERIAGYLENLGYKWSDNKYQADLAVINTCGVRQSAEDRIYGIIPSIKKKNSKAKIILTGCLSQRKDVQKRLRDKVDIWLPIVNLPKLNKLLRVTRYALRETDYLKLRPKHSSVFSAFVPIGNGCNNFCSYCVVPMARGREIYR
ncbi:tRNA (N6-isopentenyl adenosine(37)-C2)-methylthiotransferase MiaB, partial [Patescibacteria group bacterium]|nr:tRNA (N6-isopentenyl adenosine(37)-C2)-methylthiotransferase MiaB [Patescibacteria group bacterium]